MLNKDSSETLFSHPLLLSGISSIIIFEIQNRLVLLKNKIFKFIRPSPNSTFNVHNLHGIRLLARLRVGLSHLREHKFRHNFLDSIDPFCNCGRHIETTIHFFLHCSLFLIPSWTFIIKVTLYVIYFWCFSFFYCVYHIHRRKEIKGSCWMVTVSCQVKLYIFNLCCWH